MDIEDRLLQGAIDIHVHGYPEYSLRVRGRLNVIEWAELARTAQMRAIVIKSQMFPTVERAHILRSIVSDIEIYGSITLNYSIGGLNPLAVELSGELGGKIVWMPTWAAKNDLLKGAAYFKRVKQYLPVLNRVIPGPEEGIEIIENGKLKSVVKEIVQIARIHKMAIGSGHLSIAESLALAEECQRQAVPFFLTHPFLHCVGASIADLKEIVNRGGYIEHCFITVMPLQERLELSRIVEAIQEVGPSRTIMSTDAVHTYHPPPPEILRMYIASLLHLKVDETSIRKMLHENPAKILGLEEKFAKEKDIVKRLE